MTSNAELFSAAQAVIPGGVDSPVRAYGSVGGVPRFIEKAQGPWIWDAEGTRYVDLVCTWGPALLGHARPEVVSAVQVAASKGLSFGAPTRTETELADAIIERMAPVEKVRFVSTGTEATMTAVRLARGATGRDVIVKFAGNYHGHSDVLLAAAGSGVATAGLPGSAGVPAASTADTIVVDYNDVAALDAVFSERGDQIAAVIVESCPANMGVVPPRTRLQCRDSSPHNRARCPHDHRRSTHRIPVQPVGILGFATAGRRGLRSRYFHVRQGRRRWYAAGCPRWARRGHGFAGSYRPRLPGRHFVR